MNVNGVRIVAAIPGVVLLVSGFGWLTDPAAAAEGLGMPLLEGMGRSTQIGDFAAFFLGGAAIALIGAWTARTEWLLAAAMLVGGAAVMRTVAFAAHDAPFAALFIGIEVVMATILVASAVVLSKTPPNPNSG